MASITWAHVVDHYSSLSTVDTDAQTDILAHVNDALNVDDFGGEDATRLKLARVHLAAYFALLAAQAVSGSAGPVVSESVGDLSRTYANPYSSGAVTRGTNAAGDAYLSIVRGTRLVLPVVI